MANDSHFRLNDDNDVVDDDDDDDDDDDYDYNFDDKIKYQFIMINDAWWGRLGCGGVIMKYSQNGNPLTHLGLNG